MAASRKQSTAVDATRTTPASVSTVTDAQVAQIAQTLFGKAFTHGYNEEKAETYYQAIAISLGNDEQIEGALRGKRTGYDFSQASPEVAAKQEGDLTAADATLVFNFLQSCHGNKYNLGVIMDGTPTIFGKTNREIKDLEGGQPEVVWIKVQHCDVVELVDDSDKPKPPITDRPPTIPKRRTVRQTIIYGLTSKPKECICKHRFRSFDSNCPEHGLPKPEANLDKTRTQGKGGRINNRNRFGTKRRNNSTITTHGLDKLKLRSRTITRAAPVKSYAGIVKRPFIGAKVSRISRMLSLTPRWRAVRESLGEWILPADLEREVRLRAGLDVGEMDARRVEGRVDFE
jgi:hypothetical protein